MDGMEANTLVSSLSQFWRRYSSTSSARIAVLFAALGQTPQPLGLRELLFGWETQDIRGIFKIGFGKKYRTPALAAHEFVSRIRIRSIPCCRLD
jgi:hypothetical protein